MSQNPEKNEVSKKGLKNIETSKEIEWKVDYGPKDLEKKHEKVHRITCVPLKFKLKINF